MNKRINDFSVLTFDCYGTLIDWESGIWDALQPLIARSQRNDISRNKGLEAFATFETKQELDTPNMLYPDLLTRVHADIATVSYTHLRAHETEADLVCRLLL